MPDTQLSASSSDVIEMTNKGIRLSTTGGAPVQTKDLNAFFGAPYDAGIGRTSTLFDPKVVFDAGAGAGGRFFAVALTLYNELDYVTGVSKLHLAISRSSNPASLDPADWCSYAFDAKTSAGSPNAAWSDYPSIGVGKNVVAVGTNSYTFTVAEGFRYAEVRAFNKTLAVDNVTACPSITLHEFRPASAPGDYHVFNLAPAAEVAYPSSFKGTKNPLYLLSVEVRLSGEPTTSNLWVWRIRNMAGGQPTLSKKRVTGTWTYATPPDAPQPYVSAMLETGPMKMLGVVGRGNTLYGVFASACDLGASPPYESCIVFVKIAVGQNAKKKLTATLKQEFGSGAGADTFMWMPSLAVNSDSQVFVTAQAADESVEFGGLRAVGLRLDPGDNAFKPWFPITPEGQCGLGAADPMRTGDFTGTALDPGDGLSVWMAGEYAKDLGATGCWWGTTVLHATP